MPLGGATPRQALAFQERHPEFESLPLALRPPKGPLSTLFDGGWPSRMESSGAVQGHLARFSPVFEVFLGLATQKHHTPEGQEHGPTSHQWKPTMISITLSRTSWVPV
jgi:hypothetical protein